jgi:outer membrane beta-barrel protein
MSATMKMIKQLLIFSLFTLSLNAYAQDDESDSLDDILGGDDEETSTKEEKEAIETEASVNTESTALIANDSANKQIIKTLQRKTFLKLKRWEVSPHVAFVINDPFLKRRIIGTGIAYNLTEVFAIEGMIDYGLPLGDADLTTLTQQLKGDNNVAPDISRLLAFGEITFVYSPIYGKAAVLGRKIVNFDVYGKFGMGIGQTKDDGTISGILEGEDNQCPDISSLNNGSEVALFCQTQIQWHPTTTFGGGIRVIFSDNLAARLEGRSITYIETVNSTMLEMKNNFIVQGSVSVFVPNIKN